MNCKRIATLVLCAAMAAGLTACEEEGAAGNVTSGVAASTSATTPQSTRDENDLIENTDKEAKDISIDEFEPSGNAGVVKYLGFYDITTDQKGTEQTLIFKSDVYGGDIEVMRVSFGDEFYNKLAAFVASDDSPDLVTKDALLYPGNVGKNLFEPLDDYIDLNSALWKDMAPIIENYKYKGQHFFYPHMTTTMYALNYNKKTIEENDLTDPYDLYLKNEWTWDAWRELMTQFCNKSDENVGFFTTNHTITSFIATTGVPLVSANDGVITNNFQSPEVSRAMSFLEQLCREGLTYGKEFGNWIDPGDFPPYSDRLLFICTEPEWTYISESQSVQDKKGWENDVLDTPSDFSFVPFPRDPDADNYYIEYDCFGYLVPKGAKNIKGAVEFINLNRVYRTDPEIQAKVREEHIHPAPVYYTKGDYKDHRRWAMTWGEREYDLWREMCDSPKFSYVSEKVEGFSTKLTDEVGALLMGVVEQGESWTKTCEEFVPVMDAAISEVS